MAEFGFEPKIRDYESLVIPDFTILRSNFKGTSSVYKAEFSPVIGDVLDLDDDVVRTIPDIQFLGKT